MSEFTTEEIKAMETKLENMGDVEVHDYLVLESIHKWVEIMENGLKDVQDLEKEQLDEGKDVEDRLKVEIELYARSILKWKTFSALLMKGSSQLKAFHECEEAVNGKRESFVFMLKKKSN